MHFSDESHFFRAIDSHGLNAARLDSCIDPDGAPGKVRFSVPDQHSRVLHFARFLLDLSSPESDLLLLPTEWGVWKSSENWHLYNLLRKQHGEESSLKEKPCHCFRASEIEKALDFVYLFLLFSWDFYIFSYRREDILFVSHDSFVTYFSPQRAESIRNKVELQFSDSPEQLGRGTCN